MKGTIALGLGGLMWLTSFATATATGLQSSSSNSANPRLAALRRGAACPTDVKDLTALLIRDLPAYANRINQRLPSQARSLAPLSYVLLAGRPEFTPLPIQTSEAQPGGIDGVQQVFITTLERQYLQDRAVELQQFHWLFLTPTTEGWRLALMYSQVGGYPLKQPPTPPDESSQGAIGQAIQRWLRDCAAGAVAPSF